jgi:hypothetical protein
MASANTRSARTRSVIGVLPWQRRVRPGTCRSTVVRRGLRA